MRLAETRPARRAIWIVAFMLVIAGHVRALAQEGETNPAPDRGVVSLLLNAGTYTGFGVGIALGTPSLGIRAAVGWTPRLLIVTETDATRLHLYSGLEISPEVYVRMLKTPAGVHLGLQGGYRRSSLLGDGVAAGGYVQFRLSPSFDCLVSGGLQIYPSGEERLRRGQNVSEDARFGFPGPNVNLGANVGLALFP